MNKLIAILLLSTVTCFADNKFVRGKFVSGAMPYVPIVYPDLIVNGTTFFLTAGVAYQYNNIILTNGGDISIDNGDGVPVWTVIVCNNLKMYSGSLINLPDVTVWNQSSPTIATNAIDGQSLSAVYQPHICSSWSIASGAGGVGGSNYNGYGNDSSEFNGGQGIGGAVGYTGYGLTGGIGGDFGAGNPGESYNGTGTETCGYDFTGAAGGGGAGGYSKNFLYLRVKVAITYAGDAAINAGGGVGYDGGDAGSLSNFGSADYVRMGYGGEGGSGGNGGVVVQRSANSVFVPVSVSWGNEGLGGFPAYVIDYNTDCYGSDAGGYGGNGNPGNLGTSTNITP